ncbi:hypothetical protein [Candidatus Spongiisocius sp.]|uniref:hypothetical protein n=1 Tax=Candidatus Spongiisocius sp. TaxID=3101273 RepID=UPI003B594467
MSSLGGVRRTMGWAAVGILVLLVAGCGQVGTSATSAAATPATTASATTTAPATTPATTASATTTTTAPPASTIPAVGTIGVRIAPENADCGYSREPFDSYNRAAVIAAHDRSFYLGHPVGDGGGFDVEHVVAAKEACESGLPRDQWATFGADSDNLVVAVAGLNRSKGDRDIAEWGAGSSKWPTADIPAGRWCAYVTLTRDIKAAYDLAMDQAEASVMTRWLENCGEVGIQVSSATATTRAPTISTPVSLDEGCTHWHAGNPKHTHPGTDHDGTHRSGKCAGY